MLEEIISEYKYLCATDHYNRKKLFYRNKIQCELIKCSGLSSLDWVIQYGAIFEEVLVVCNNKEEIENRLYQS